MDTMNTAVDEYINRFNGEEKARLCALRDLVRSEVPEAEEGFMPHQMGTLLFQRSLRNISKVRARSSFH